jgi:hypothetical protein
LRDAFLTSHAVDVGRQRHGIEIARLRARQDVLGRALRETLELLAHDPSNAERVRDAAAPVQRELLGARGTRGKDLAWRATVAQRSRPRIDELASPLKLVADAAPGFPGKLDEWLETGEKLARASKRLQRARAASRAEREVIDEALRVLGAARRMMHEEARLDGTMTPGLPETVFALWDRAVNRGTRRPKASVGDAPAAQPARADAVAEPVAACEPLPAAAAA